MAHMRLILGPLVVAGAPLLAPALVVQSQPPYHDTARVSGQVIETNSHQPVAGAIVVLNGYPVFDASPQTIADNAGRFTFGRLPGGRYSVSARKIGFIADGPSSMFEIEPGQERDGVTVSIERGGVITGRVVDPFGNPLNDAYVSVLQRARSEPRPPALISWPVPRSEPVAASSRTNDIGEFRIIGLRSG